MHGTNSSDRETNGRVSGRAGDLRRRATARRLCFSGLRSSRGRWLLPIHQEQEASVEAVSRAAACPSLTRSARVR